MTSRDLTENVEQLQVRQSLALLRDRAVAALARLARLAAEHEATVMAGRSHNVAAQATTLGKRFATVADELLVGARAASRSCWPATRCAASRARWAPRQDMLDLLDGDAAQLAELETPGRRAPRLRPGADQRRPGLPALPGLRRRLRAGPARLRPVQPGDHDPADGRPRAGHRGLRRGPGRLVGDAAQDEHPLLRAGQRPGRRAARPPVDDRRARRRPVERGRRLRARSYAGSRCPTRSSPPTGCSRPSSPCSTSSAPSRR